MNFLESSCILQPFEDSHLGPCHGTLAEQSGWQVALQAAIRTAIETPLALTGLLAFSTPSSGGPSPAQHVQESLTDVRLSQGTREAQRLCSSAGAPARSPARDRGDQLAIYSSRSQQSAGHPAPATPLDEQMEAAWGGPLLGVAPRGAEVRTNAGGGPRRVRGRREGHGWLRLLGRGVTEGYRVAGVAIGVLEGLSAVAWGDAGSSRHAPPNPWPSLLGSRDAS